MGKHGRDYFKESKLGSYSNVVDSFGETVTCTGWILILSVFFNGLLELHGQVSPPSHLSGVPSLTSIRL